MECKYCNSEMLCVNKERTIWRCDICGKGIMITELETTRKKELKTKELMQTEKIFEKQILDSFNLEHNKKTGELQEKESD